MPNHFIEHLLDTVSVRFSQVQLTVSETTVVSSVSVANLTSAPASPCSLSPPPCPLHPTTAWKLADVGDERQEVRRPVTDASGGFAAVRRVAQRRRRRPAPPNPPEVAAWPSTPQCALPPTSCTAGRGARSLPPSCPCGHPTVDRRHYAKTDRD